MIDFEKELTADKAKEFVDTTLFYNGTTMLSTSQIRKFLTAVNVLENKIISQGEKLSAETVNEIKFLKVKLAYQVGRTDKNKKRHIEEFYKKLEPFISEIDDSKQKFTQFARYLESVVAYHKFNGGD